MNLTVRFFILSLWLPQIFCKISDFWSLTDTLAEKETIELSSFSNKEFYYSTKLLKSLQGTDSNRCGIYCGSNKVYADVEDLFYLDKSIELCGCRHEHTSDDIEIVQNAIQSTQLKSMIYGLILASHSNSIAIEEKRLMIETISNKLNELQQDGSEYADSIDSSLDFCENFGGDPDASALLNLVSQKAQLFLPHVGETLSLDASFISRLKSCSTKSLKLSSANVLKIAQQLLQLRHSSNIVTVARAYESLLLISSLKNAPLLLSLDTNIVERDIVTFQLFDVFGKVVKFSKAELSTLKDSIDGTTVVENVLVADNSINLSKMKLSPGIYTAEFSIYIEEKRVSLLSNSISFIVPSPAVSIQDVKFEISESKSTSSMDMIQLPQENMVDEHSASASSFDYIHFHFIVSSSSKPSFCSVLLFNEDKFFVTYAPTSLGCDESGCKYKLAINLADDIEKFQYISGKYVLSILVGDITITSPVKWVVGSIIVKFPARIDQKLSLYKRSLLYTSDTTLRALPEISHIMRPPSKSAGDFAAITFTVAVLVPLLGVIIYWLSTVKPDLKSKSIFSSGLVLSWLSLLTLYTGYWLALDGFSFYSTIKYLCILAPITLILGRNIVGNR